jgi:hypothetical protein
MCASRRLLLLTASLLVLSVPLVALSDQKGSTLEQNRQQLNEWRKDAQHYARLKRDGRAFLSLPLERREQMVKLDQALHGEKGSGALRLKRTLDRYVSWLERLPEAERRRIREIPDRAKRLQCIRELREKEWVARLPLAYRQKVEKAQGKERQLLIRRYKLEERQRRIELQPYFQTFVREYLYPKLNAEEKQRLERVEGKWPDFASALVEVAAKYPPALPGPWWTPKSIEELPLDLQNRLGVNKKATLKVPPLLKNAETKWPKFGTAVSKYAHLKGISLPYELWPARPRDLSPPVRHFLEKKLLPVLDVAEKNRLQNAEDVWPRYPLMIQELAKKHKLQVPWLTLPGPREHWENIRARAWENWN